MCEVREVVKKGKAKLDRYDEEEEWQESRRVWWGKDEHQNHSSCPPHCPPQ
jgi:hypothetical protein